MKYELLRVLEPAQDRTFEARGPGCVGGECVWLRWASRDGASDTETPRARLLRAYLLDLSGLCRCPRRRFSRWV